MTSAAGGLDLEMILQLHATHGLHLGKPTPIPWALHIGGERETLVTELLRLARLGQAVQAIAAAHPRKEVRSAVREATLRVAALWRPGPGEAV